MVWETYRSLQEVINKHKTCAKAEESPLDEENVLVEHPMSFVSRKT